MNRYRGLWMERMLAREARMMDGQIITGVAERNRVLRLDIADRAGRRGDAVPLARRHADDRRRAAVRTAGQSYPQWEVKVIGLMIIFIYAFFKFAWAYRLYNYVAIMVGAAPPAAEKRFARGARIYASMRDDGHHRGRTSLQPRPAGFLLSLGYLGWFLGPLPLIATTAAILVVIWRRQFASQSRRAVLRADVRTVCDGLDNGEQRDQQHRSRSEQRGERGLDPDRGANSDSVARVSASSITRGRQINRHVIFPRKRCANLIEALRRHSRIGRAPTADSLSQEQQYPGKVVKAR